MEPDGAGEPDEFTPGTTVVASDTPLGADVGDEQVLLEVDSGRYYGVNDVGSFVWEFVQEPRTVREVSEKVSSTFDVEVDRCEPDVRGFLRDLHDAGLIDRPNDA